MRTWALSTDLCIFYILYEGHPSWSHLPGCFMICCVVMFLFLFLCCFPVCYFDLHGHLPSIQPWQIIWQPVILGIWVFCYWSIQTQIVSITWQKYDSFLVSYATLSELREMQDATWRMIMSISRPSNCERFWVQFVTANSTIEALIVHLCRNWQEASVNSACSHISSFKYLILYIFNTFDTFKNFEAYRQVD